MKIGILGSGGVGDTLAAGFLKYGHEVKRGSRDPNKLSDWLSKAGKNASIGTFKDAAQFGDVIVLVVKGEAAEEALKLAGLSNLNGKTIIDATNPIANKPSENGVLHFFTDLNDSLMERLQRLAPEANFVKAFSCVGRLHMVNPQFKEGKPTMFICGNNANAKNQVAEILIQFGWEVEDMGSVTAARAIEPLCILWCIPAFTRNQMNHAFKLLKG